MLLLRVDVPTQLGLVLVDGRLMQPLEEFYIKDGPKRDFSFLFGTGSQSPNKTEITHQSYGGFVL